MKAVVVLAASGAAVGGLYLGGAFERGEVYDLPIAEARARLGTVTMPQPISATAGGAVANLSIDSASDTYTWEITAGSGAVAQFSAHLTAEGPKRTRVLLDYKNLSSQAPWADRLLSTRFMRSYAQSSFHEQVDAALEARAPDQRQAMQSFAMHAVAHPEEMREVGFATQEIFKDVANEIEAERTMDTLYGSGSPRERMAAATRPSRDATRPSTELPSD